MKFDLSCLDRVVGWLWPPTKQLRVETHLENWDEGTGGPAEWFSGERHEGAEQGLEALEGFRDAVVVGG